MSISRVRHAALVALLLVGAAACASPQGSTEEGATEESAQPPSSAPDAIVVLGHSGATGYASDPADPRSDARENSWATGDNPDVDSLYLRMVADNPAMEGNNFNLAQDGSRVDDLLDQAREAVTLEPLPDVFVIQSVDNDMSCDGTDPSNYEPFGTTFAEALEIIVEGAPGAEILVVSSPWATAQDYTDVVADIPAARALFTGDGPCDLFDISGQQNPTAIAYQQDVIDHYFAQLAQHCADYPNCRYDDGAMGHLVIDAGDLSPDFNHMSIAGHAKAAATEWAAFF